MRRFVTGEAFEGMYLGDYFKAECRNAAQGWSLTSLKVSELAMHLAEPGK